MKTFKVHLSIAIGAILAVALLSWLLTEPAPEKPKVQLPNGITLTLESVSYGPNHRYTERYFRPPLPFPQSSSIGISTPVAVPKETQTEISQWQPDPLPASRQVGEVEVVLKGVRAQKRGTYNGFPDRRLHFDPRFEVNANGKPASDWKIRPSSISDPTLKNHAVWNIASP